MTYTLPTTTFGTNAAAALMLAFISLPVPPSIEPMEDLSVPLIIPEHLGPSQAAAWNLEPEHLGPSQAAAWNLDTLMQGTPPSATLIGFVGDAALVAFDVDRETTARERAIGEIRSWTLLSSDWDGEGAEAPKIGSLKEAWTFLSLLAPNAYVPEPMLLASGNAGLYWNDGALYGDLEFIGNGQVTYYIEHRGMGKHKGVVAFHGNDIPAIFLTLLPT
jgi:hypothetical protein